MLVMPTIHKTLCRRSMSMIIINNPEFRPMLNVIFSDRLTSHPSSLNNRANKSSQFESENSFSTIVTIQSRRTNSETRVTNTKHSVRNRTKTFSVNVNNNKQMGGNQLWIPAMSLYRPSSVNPGVYSRIQSATSFIVSTDKSKTEEYTHKDKQY